MPRPRKELVCITDTPYYHVVSRCVRRTFLCGTDTNGKDYEYRRQWIVNRIRILSSLFAIDICSYAVMSNHYHIVLKICPEQSNQWSNKEIIQRWTSLYNGPTLIQKAKIGDLLSQAEQATVESCIKCYKQRLSCISWFMKCLNEPIARQANKEDDCTGHFWESRFKSQALRSDKALLSCMAYVDLNPIRAGMADTPEESDHTSIQERITPHFNLSKSIKEAIEEHTLNEFTLPLKALATFKTPEKTHANTIKLTFKDYLKLVDITGRVIRDNKLGIIPEHLPTILKRVNINPIDWQQNTESFEQHYYRHFGRKHIITNSS